MTAADVIRSVRALWRALWGRTTGAVASPPLTDEAGQILDTMARLAELFPPLEPVHFAMHPDDFAAMTLEYGEGRVAGIDLVVDPSHPRGVVEQHAGKPRDCIPCGLHRARAAGWLA